MTNMEGLVGVVVGLGLLATVLAVVACVACMVLRRTKDGVTWGKALRQWLGGKRRISRKYHFQSSTAVDTYGRRLFCSLTSMNHNLIVSPFRSIGESWSDGVTIESGLESNVISPQTQEQNQCTSASKKDKRAISSPTPVHYQRKFSVSMYEQDPKTPQNLYTIHDLENMSGGDNNSSSKKESANDVTSINCAYMLGRETDILEEESDGSFDCDMTLTNPFDTDNKINSEKEESTPPSTFTTPQTSYVTIPVPPQTCPKTPHPSPSPSKNLTPSQTSHTPSPPNPTPPRQSTGITTSGVVSQSRLLAHSQSNFSGSILDLSKAPGASQSMPNLNTAFYGCPLRTRGGRPIMTSSVSRDVDIMWSISVENPSTGVLTSTRVEQSITSM